MEHVFRHAHLHAWRCEKCGHLVYDSIPPQCPECLKSKQIKIEKKILVFVYGTLLRGFSNNCIFEDYQSRFLGAAMTKDKYKLYVTGYPMAFRPKVYDGDLTEIHGEVYEVDEETLKRLDHLEGHPDFYKRKLMPIVMATGKEIRAYIYLCNPLKYREPNQVEEIKNGDFKSWYQAKMIKRD